MKQPFKFRHYKEVFAVASAAAVFATIISIEPTFAVDKIYSPQIVEGEWELEYFGTRTFDHQHDKNNLQEHEISVGYGANNWWWPELYGLFGKQADESVKMTGVQLENRFQFTEPGEYWVDPGLLLAYTHATHKDNPDTLEVKLLLEKQTGRFLHRANVGIEQSVGPHAQGGPDRVILWNSRYLYDPHFAPGFEIQSDFGKPDESYGFNRQEHYIGPSAYGEILPHLKYEAAYLFGVSNAASKGAARFLLEYEAFF
jgi:hypothetical protein